MMMVKPNSYFKKKEYHQKNIARDFRASTTMVGEGDGCIQDCIVIEGV
jgi:hypothetical protein